MIGLHYGRSGDVLGTVLAVALLTGLVFGSVLAHELGHALTARRFGVGTREILLLPIGGVALLEGEAERPRHDLLIALAGPAVSLVLGGVAWGLSLLTSGDLFWLLAEINLALGLFNLVPAFPLDGGRVVRAGLTRWMGRTRATSAAARLGRLIAVALVALAAIDGQWLLGLVGVFVYVAASAEERQLVIADIIGSRIAADIMKPVRRIFAVATPLGEVGEALAEDSGVRAFPVIFGERILGVLYREPVLEALSLSDQPIRLRDLLDRNVTMAAPSQPLRELLVQMGQARSRAAVVLDADANVSGLVLIDDVVDEIRRGRDREF
jgi:Zn-dependent protease